MTAGEMLSSNRTTFGHEQINAASQQAFLGCPLQVVVCMVGQVEVEAVFPEVDDVGGVCVCVCVYLGVLGCYRICDT